jgi:hypothetical protein
MPELKDSLGLNVHYINPHTGREHAATIIKIREDEAVNLIHYDPDTSLQQARFGVVYSHEPIANSFHWLDDDNSPKNDEEKAAQILARVSSSQNRAGAPPTAAFNVPAQADPAQSQPEVQDVPHTSVELAQADAPVVQPVAATIPAENPAEPTTPDQTPPPNPEPPIAATIEHDTAYEADKEQPLG